MNEVKAMTDENERCFTIDNSLKRYDSAVRHLCRCRPIRTDQITSYMKLHRVYVSVIEELCTVSPVSEVKETLQAAAYLQAEILVSRENHEEAGYLYHRVGLYNLAVDSFKQCGLWKNCLSIASFVHMR